MNKFTLLAAVIFLSMTTNAFAVQQTICFSKSKIANTEYWQGSIGDGVNLHGGQCNGKKLAHMNKLGWKLVFVITGLNSSFGMVLEKN